VTFSRLYQSEEGTFLAEVETGGIRAELSLSPFDLSQGWFLALPE
jgi:hypothetical protein